MCGERAAEANLPTATITTSEPLRYVPRKKAQRAIIHYSHTPSLVALSALTRCIGCWLSNLLYNRQSRSAHKSSTTTLSNTSLRHVSTMDKSAALQRNVSNARPFGIFVSYMCTCLALTVFVIVKLFDKTEKLHAANPLRLPQRKHVLLFAVLAAASLLSTWSFMFQYFRWSYDNWLTVRSQHNLDPSVKHWELWLKETSLFREAWVSVIIGQNRYWWSHQIFYFASALGLHSEWKGMSYTGVVKSIAK